MKKLRKVGRNFLMKGTAGGLQMLRVGSWHLRNDQEKIPMTG